MFLVRNNRGFTLLELLIVISITMTLSTMAMPIYGNLQSATDLGESSLQVAHIFRKARTWSYNAYRDKSYGVYFDHINKTFVLYTGDSYATRDQSLDNVITFSPGVFVSSSIVNQEVHFAKWTGMPNQDGFFEIGHQSVNNIRRININTLGAIDVE